jgi:hypothetical protein
MKPLSKLQERLLHGVVTELETAIWMADLNTANALQRRGLVKVKHYLFSFEVRPTEQGKVYARAKGWLK